MVNEEGKETAFRSSLDAILLLGDRPLWRRRVSAEGNQQQKKMSQRGRWAGLLVGVLAVVALGGSGCRQKREGEYVNRSRGFSLVFPADWEVREKEMNLDVIALSPLTSTEDKFRENITVASSEMTTAMTPEQILEANLPAMMNVITDFNPLERGSASLNGRSAVWLTYTQRQGRFRLKVKLYAVAGSSRAFLIHCVTEENQDLVYANTFEKIVSTLRVK